MNSSKNKGSRFEREIVIKHRELGIDAERIPLSGAAKGSYSGDIRIADLIGECKIRRSDFTRIYDWLEHDNVDFLVVRTDRKPPIYVLTEETWLRLIKSLMSMS